jgi:3D (Asp-Asp-Asp) domain-containing protein
LVIGTAPSSLPVFQSSTLAVFQPSIGVFGLINRNVSFTYGTLMTDALRYTMLGLILLVAGCAPNAEKGKTTQALSGRSHEQKVVKTTAYTASECRHRRSGTKNAIGSQLQSGTINSAAADWSHFPVGTKFRIVDNDKTYVIDDYGSALVGTDTIDLYVPSRWLMNRWGSRKVTIEVLEEGSFEKSLELLKPRQINRHVRQMVKNIQKQIDEDAY